MRRLQIAIFLLCVGWYGIGARAVAQAAGDVLDTLSPEDVTKRDELMKPGLDLIKAGDNKGALAALRPAQKAFPDDLRVLRYTAAAAMGAGENDEALALFTRALAKHPNQPWPLRLAVLQLEARLARWDDFDRDLTALRAAKKSGTDHQLDGSNGFIIDEFDVAGKHVQAVVFPLLAGNFHVLYRFLLPKATPTPETQAGTTVPAQGDRCKNPNFQPYINVESDDIDQVNFKKTHPELAEKGERSYSLDTYGAPCSQGLIKFYFEGEPTYETVRADVTKALSYVPKPAPAKP